MQYSSVDSKYGSCIIGNSIYGSPYKSGTGKMDYSILNCGDQRGQVLIPMSF